MNKFFCNTIQIIYINIIDKTFNKKYSKKYYINLCTNQNHIIIVK